MPHFRNKNTFYAKPFRVVLPQDVAGAPGSNAHSTTRVLRSSRGGMGRTNLSRLQFDVERTQSCPYLAPSKKPATPPPGIEGGFDQGSTYHHRHHREQPSSGERNDEQRHVSSGRSAACMPPGSRGHAAHAQGVGGERSGSRGHGGHARGGTGGGGGGGSRAGEGGGGGGGGGVRHSRSRAGDLVDEGQGSAVDQEPAAEHFEKRAPAASRKQALSVPGGRENREERKRVRAALRGVYSRLLALKSRQPITGAEIASALEELGVRVDTTTAGILEQHVTPNVPPELHPGKHVGSVKVPVSSRQDPEGVSRDKAFQNAYEEMRQRVSVDKGLISKGLKDAAKGGRQVGARELSEILSQCGVSGDARLVDAVSLLAADDEGGTIDVGGVHRAITSITNPSMGSGESWRDRVAHYYALMSPSKVSMVRASQSASPGGEMHRDSYRGFLGALWPSLQKQMGCVSGADADTPPKQSKFRGGRRGGASSCEPSLFGAGKFSMPTLPEGKHLTESYPVRPHSSMLAHVQASRGGGRVGTGAGMRPATGMSVASSAWSLLGEDEEVARSEELKLDRRYGSQMREVLEPDPVDTDGTAIASHIPDKDRWQTIGRLAAGGHAGNKGLVDEHSRVHSTDLHYFNRLLHVAENRERVDGGAHRVNEAKEQKYLNRLMKMRIDHENRQRKILRDRDRHVFIGNVVHQQSDMDMPIARVKELHISDGTTMERQRIAAAERLEREKEARRSKDMKDELAVKIRAEKLVEYKLKEDENKRKLDEKAEMKFMADRQRVAARLAREKMVHKSDSWSAEQAIFPSKAARPSRAPSTDVSAEDVKLARIKEERMARDEAEEQTKRNLFDKDMTRGRRNSQVRMDSMQTFFQRGPSLYG